MHIKAQETDCIDQQIYDGKKKEEKIFNFWQRDREMYLQIKKGLMQDPLIAYMNIQNLIPLPIDKTSWPISSKERRNRFRIFFFLFWFLLSWAAEKGISWRIFPSLQLDLTPMGGERKRAQEDEEMVMSYI